MHPKTAEDFAILFNELEKWREAETKRIESSDLEERERLEELAQVNFFATVKASHWLKAALCCGSCCTKKQSCYKQSIN